MYESFAVNVDDAGDLVSSRIGVTRCCKDSLHLFPIAANAAEFVHHSLSHRLRLEGRVSGRSLKLQNGVHVCSRGEEPENPMISVLPTDHLMTR